MPFVIPNATDTTSGNKYYSLDQAEPDALDFEFLGNRSTGILTGCEVTVASGSTVRVSSGVAVLGNVSYVVGETTNLQMPSSPVNNRFDLVVLRKSGESLVATVVSGPDSQYNPTFPPTTTRMVNTLPPSNQIDPSTDVVLAAVYRPGANGIDTKLIVDKRISLKADITLRGVASPSNSLGSDGALYYKSGSLSSTESSGVYVKRGSEWQELAKYPVDPGVPVGTVIMWPVASSPNSNVWLECNGAEINRTQYAMLFSVLGTTYGAGNGSSTFNLPDFRGRYLSGLPSAGRALGTSYGSNTVTLAMENLAAHGHSLNDGVVVEALAHQHDIAHGHGKTSTENEGVLQRHTHTFNGFTQETTVVTVQNLSALAGSSPGYETNMSINAIESPNNNKAHRHYFAGTTDTNNDLHAHLFEVPQHEGLSGEAGRHSHQLNGSTNATGENLPFSIEPATYHVRFFIRYA